MGQAAQYHKVLYAVGSTNSFQLHTFMLFILPYCHSIMEHSTDALQLKPSSVL